MRVLALQAVGFRNLTPLDLQTAGDFVVVHGPNGQGKTNLLEALFLLATLRPLRARRAQELIQFGGEAAVLGAHIDGGGLLRRYKLQLGAGGRQLHLDGQRAEPSAWFEGVRAVAFTPTDAEIVLGGPAERRAWVDRAAFTRSPAHLEAVLAYRRVLEQKGAALRQGNEPSVLDVLDVQLATLGARVVARRLGILAELAPRVNELHSSIAGGEGTPVTLRYRSEIAAAGTDGLEARLRELLQRRRPEEVRRRTPLVGPQRDDVEIGLGGSEARAFGSRGQVRSVVLALKLAELVAARDAGEVPLFLLDDLSSELDRDRTRRLVEVLQALRAQVWITTTDPDHLGELPSDRATFVALREGTVERRAPAI